MCVRLIKKFLNIKKKGWKFLSELGQIRLIEFTCVLVKNLSFEVKNNAVFE